MNLRKSFYARIKSLLTKENQRDIIKRNGLAFEVFRNSPLELIEAMETIRNFSFTTNILLDIGAHKGLFSKIANAFFRFQKTICFEPNPELHDSIRLNNKDNTNLLIENIALSGQEGQTTFFLYQDSTMNSLVESDQTVLREEFPWDNPDKMKKTVVNTNTLDNYMVNNFHEDDSFFLKIDTQGNELNVLRNGLSVLRQTQICVIEFMFTKAYKADFSFVDLLNFMAEQKFECMGALSISKRPSKRISAVDFLFVKVNGLN